MDTPARKSYPLHVTDDEWAFVSPYSVLMTQNAPQRDYSLREVFNGLRWITRTGAQWRNAAQRRTSLAYGLSTYAAVDLRGCV